MASGCTWRRWLLATGPRVARRQRSWSPLRPFRPPVSKPEADQNAAISTVVTLNGRQSNDPTGIPLASHQWTLISAPASGGVSIQNAHGPIAQFIPTAVGDYVFEFQVGGWRNGGINYAYERTTVHVHN